MYTGRLCAIFFSRACPIVPCTDIDTIVSRSTVFAVVVNDRLRSFTYPYLPHTFHSSRYGDESFPTAASFLLTYTQQLQRLTVIQGEFRELGLRKYINYRYKCRSARSMFSRIFRFSVIYNHETFAFKMPVYVFLYASRSRFDQRAFVVLNIFPTG